MSDVHVVILAAGKGTRMKSLRPKVLHDVAGLPIIEHVLAAAAALSPRSTTVVIGHQGDAVRGALAAHGELEFVVQEPQLGTAHALLTTEPLLRDQGGTLVLLSGDVPALRAETLQELVRVHTGARASTTVVTAVVPVPHGYGRIVRDGENIARIVEEKDASPAERAINEINAGIYAFDLSGLFEDVRGIGSGNVQREYYLPDLVAIHRAAKRSVETVTVADASEIMGINSRAELADVARHLRLRTNAALMAAGVTLEDPATTYIDPQVEIGADTIVKPGVTIQKGTVIGSGCVIHSGVRLANSRIGDRAVVLDHCVISDSDVGAGASVGPFAHLRGDTQVAPKAKIGNFVELKKTVLGEGSKASHLAYLGDAVIGTGVNIGAGTITCNYDGVRKQVTTIADGAFIGSDTQLIAPVTVGEGAYVGTGTTIRENVPPGALAVSAGKQRNIEGWVERRKKRGAD
ncbi:MAG TPA: bifunctional UDP-N-acetylglucosamine diphosphorylase/glucosamine-1-phosphate N-acetyltransferase GlmU [Vicinamibacterales bacterium]|nr:bifunctional UDP-N-acetylglucosamine diphosphorylase/glucosamine-1-phosphate N-acetyltransferase GlmU [Vicinamibacterales bacterium]